MLEKVAFSHFFDTPRRTPQGAPYHFRFSKDQALWDMKNRRGPVREMVFNLYFAPVFLPLRKITPISMMTTDTARYQATAIPCATTAA